VSIKWFYLLLAVGLLLPRLPFSPGMWKGIRHSSHWHPGAIARVWQNWVDLIRAALGVYLLNQHAIVVTDAESPGADFKALALQATVLGLVLLVQMIRVPRTVQFLAPVFYLSGLTFILSGYLPGAFAVGVGWLFAVGGKNLAYQLPAMAVALAAAAYILGPLLPLMVNCGLILIPLILSALFKKRLLFAASSPSGN
jgi:hypothetical protein